MIKAPLVDGTGAARGEVDLPEQIFGIAPNAAVVHEVLAWQLAARHLGTHSTKTRGEVRGGGRKPWRQKGTGRARHGSRRSPLWVGGGITFGPRPAPSCFALPKCVRRRGLGTLLADKARSAHLTVVEELRVEAPRTKELAALLARLGVGEEKVVLVTAAPTQTLVKAADNLPGVTGVTGG